MDTFIIMIHEKNRSLSLLILQKNVFLREYCEFEDFEVSLKFC